MSASSVLVIFPKYHLTESLTESDKQNAGVWQAEQRHGARWSGCARQKHGPTTIPYENNDFDVRWHKQNLFFVNGSTRRSIDCSRLTHGQANRQMPHYNTTVDTCNSREFPILLHTFSRCTLFCKLTQCRYFGLMMTFKSLKERWLFLLYFNMRMEISVCMALCKCCCYYYLGPVSYTLCPEKNETKMFLCNIFY